MCDVLELGSKRRHDNNNNNKYKIAFSPITCITLTQIELEKAQAKVDVVSRPSVWSSCQHNLVVIGYAVTAQPASLPRPDLIGRARELVDLLLSTMFGVSRESVNFR